MPSGTLVMLLCSMLRELMRCKWEGSTIGKFVNEFLLNWIAVFFCTRPNSASYKDACVRVCEFNFEHYLLLSLSLSLPPPTPSPRWSTHWFRCETEVPQGPEWAGRQVRLRWDSGCEAMVGGGYRGPMQKDV